MTAMIIDLSAKFLVPTIVCISYMAIQLGRKRFIDILLSDSISQAALYLGIQMHHEHSEGKLRWHYALRQPVDTY
jgi:hypothetical protein